MNVNPSQAKPTMMGFGEHCSPVGYSTYKNAKLISEIAIALLLAGTVGTIVIASVPFFPLGGVTLAAPMVMLAASSAFLATGAISSVIYYKSCKSALFGVLNQFIHQIEQPHPLGKAQNCDGIVCDDSMESYEWKKKLIKAAEHNIVISGNYCGGGSFDEILTLIEEQLMCKPTLKVVILSSDKFISESNQKKIEHLEATFNQRFQLVETPDIYHINPSLKKSTNHSKILAIDYGKYFILGGSGLEDKYALAKGLGDRGQKGQQVGGLLNYFL